jgi:hypothetical protein
MSEKTLNTLFELLGDHKVEVPMLQRDYAQGRQDSHASMVRYNLLNDIKSAILGQTPPLDLNFVYGKTIDGKFIPIDGQQRLTTLFLFHLYAFRDDDSKTDILIKFTYETRKSSRDFLEKLVLNRASVFSMKLKPSEVIRDSAWFVSLWQNDPTVQSCLTMLDDIQNVFADITDLDKKLINTNVEPVIFRFLEMTNLGMEDNLYIKLNARGKPLTSLENFKACLIGRLRSDNFEKSVSFKVSDFENLLDGKWTDLFWSKSHNDFDRTYLDFFSILLDNAKIDVALSNPKDYNKISSQIYETAYYTLNFLCNNSTEPCSIIFKTLDNRTYPNRVLFHIVTTYFYYSHGVDSDSLTQWIRILKNLTLNSTIDNDERCYSAISGINTLSDNWTDLLSYFSTNSKIFVQGFNGEQIEEEQIKARIIRTNTTSDFAKLIYGAEQHPYFSGQIRSALYLAKTGENNFDKEIFMQYWGKVSELFDNDKSKYEHLLRQALLAYGDYTLSVSGYKTLCVDNPNEMQSSLKRLFSENSNIVKKFLDTLKVGKDIELQLKEIKNNVPVPTNNWRYCFIKFPDLFSWMSSTYLRLGCSYNGIIIVPNISSRGYNYDVFLGALYLSLRQNNIDSYLDGDMGSWGDRYLCVNKMIARFKDNNFIIINTSIESTVFETKTEDIITEATDYFKKAASEMEKD